MEARGEDDAIDGWLLHSRADWEKIFPLGVIVPGRAADIEEVAQAADMACATLTFVNMRLPCWSAVFLLLPDRIAHLASSIIWDQGFIAGNSSFHEEGTSRHAA
ncbi:hypothetical protein KUV28_11955 [Ferrimonas balearica]|nr:hypothetical protein [Ferrimonas balearica]